MSVPCPHCGFLVALIAVCDRTPQRCPRCDNTVAPPEVIAADDALVIDVADTGSTDVGSADFRSTDFRSSDVAAADTVPATPPQSVQADAVIEQPPPDASAAAMSAAAMADGEYATPTFEQAIKAAAIAPAMPRRQRRVMRPRRQDEPSFASRHRVAASPHWHGWTVLAGLALLLGAQLLLAQRRELAANAYWRPYISALCTVVGCQLPPWHEPAAFTMIQRNVRAKSGNTGVLTVKANFRNDAHWPQPWPTLVLGLSDADGQLAGQRAFTADEYHPGHRAGEVLLPGQSTTVTLEVIEPAPRIVAFTFDFR